MDHVIDTDWSVKSLHQALVGEDLMTHPDVLHLLDAVGRRRFVDEDGGAISGAHP